MRFLDCFNVAEFWQQPPPISNKSPLLAWYVGCCYSSLTPSVSMCMHVCTKGVRSWLLTVLQQITAELANADSCKGLLMKLLRGDKTVTSDGPNQTDRMQGEDCQSWKLPRDNRMLQFIVECFDGKWKDETNRTDLMLSFMSIMLSQRKWRPHDGKIFCWIPFLFTLTLSFAQRLNPYVVTLLHWH